MHMPHAQHLKHQNTFLCFNYFLRYFMFSWLVACAYPPEFFVATRLYLRDFFQVDYANPVALAAVCGAVVLVAC